ncbi:MAG: type II secretion system F family protein [Thermoplasmataceae archaeon]|jgi:flagellar protein FlaJ
MVDNGKKPRISRRKKESTGPVIEDMNSSARENDNPPENSFKQDLDQAHNDSEHFYTEDSGSNSGPAEMNKERVDEEATGFTNEGVQNIKESDVNVTGNEDYESSPLKDSEQVSEKGPYSLNEEQESRAPESDMQSISDLDEKENEKSELLERAIGGERGSESGTSEDRRKISTSRGRKSKDKSRSSRKSSVSVKSEQKGKRISLPRLFARKNSGKNTQLALGPEGSTTDSTGQVSRLIFTRQLITTKDKLSPSTDKTRSSKKKTVITTGRVNVALPNPSPALKMSLRLFRTYFEGRSQRYAKLEENLRKAKMSYSAVQYLSFATFVSIVIAAVIAAFSVLLFIILGPLGILAVVFGGVGILAFVGVFLSLPSSTANKRKKDIESKIPIAISYIATMASADMPIDVILRELGESPEYGEVAKEAKSISMSSRVFGNDIVTAMREGARNSPSRKFSEFLQGIVTTVTSGGNLKEYFKSKATQYQDELNTIIKSNAESIGILAESYVTVGVAFPLMLIVILGVVAALESASTGMAIVLYLIVLMIIPLITIAFSFLISSTIKEVNI